MFYSFHCTSLLPSCVLSCFSHVQLFATACTVACKAPRSMEFSRQEYCTGLPCPSPGDLTNPGLEPASLMSAVSQAGSLPPVPPGKPLLLYGVHCKSY